VIERERVLRKGKGRRKLRRIREIVAWREEEEDASA
jgi:hypothetical protein